jgi:glucose-1-phosphate cytidylyltransferase
MKEETEFRPKPMVEVGGVPLLWHIMRIYMHYGHNEFIIAAGYKGEMIKEFFHNWRALLHDFTLDTSTGTIEILEKDRDNFKITIVDTGTETLTGGRILKVAPYIKGNEFMVTYGDGVSDVNINNLIDFHHKHNKMGTLTGVHPQSRFGLVDMDPATNLITRFRQKPVLEEFVSGGFMVFKKEALKHFTVEEMEVGLKNMAGENQLVLYPHEGFWKAVDTYNELKQLNDMWADTKPWAVWEK